MPVRQVPRFDDALDPVEVADVPTVSNVETPNTSSAHASVAPWRWVPQSSKELRRLQSKAEEQPTLGSQNSLMVPCRQVG